jgi:hypothetical protein
MRMIEEREDYNKVVRLLRKSKPLLDSTEDIEREVFGKISEKHHSGLILSDLVGFLFGWIYIGWVRRCLVAASVVLIVIFIWQQGTILKEIGFLRRQTILIEGENLSDPDYIMERRIMYKLEERRFPSRTITISEKQMDQLLESINDLQVRYKDLMKLIEEDPELKKMLERKLIENSKSKIKL